MNFFKDGKLDLHALALYVQEGYKVVEQDPLLSASLKECLEHLYDDTHRRNEDKSRSKNNSD